MGNCSMNWLAKGRNIVLLHGGMVNREIWDEQFPLLAKTFRVVRYDRRGYGKSSDPEMKYSHIEDLSRLFIQLSIDRAIVFGMSSGGRLAIDFALTYPEKVTGLVLVSAVVSGFGYTSHMHTRGANYGWPFYSIGVNYDNTAISSGHSASGIKAPVHTWTPSIATCGIAFISSNKFKSWKGNLLVSGLVSQKLIRCVVNGDKIVEEDVLLSNSGRVRNVVQAPDGSIYMSVENPGRIIQILPE
ncbi:MAG: alpha/beta fold hydrolase [Bacteroidales bacterium]|nr:alpha/beta fold hydrolase [Bacteroidales bacterium]